LLKLNINNRPLLVFEKICKWVVRALGYPLLFFLQSNQLKIPEIILPTSTGQILAIFATGAVMIPMFLELLSREIRSFCLSLIRIAYCETSCLVLLYSSIEPNSSMLPKLALKMAFLHFLFFVACAYLRFKQPDGHGVSLSNNLIVVQGLLEVSVFLSLMMGQT